MAKRWYVIHTQTGYEDKVKSNLEKKIQQDGLGHLISQVMVPTEQISEIRAGKKRISQRKFFPGYVLVEMEFNEETWRLIKGVPGVTRFIGAGSRPVPLQEEEVKNILKQAETAKEKPIPKVVFEKGEAVKIVEGPFINFNGTVEEVNPAKGKLTVLVSVFGRSTPLELEYWQVEKI